jgi:hypothetical protein
MKVNLSEKVNEFDQEIIKLAHIVGDLQRKPELDNEDRKYLEKMFYTVHDMRYCDLSNQELCRLKAKLTIYSFIESGLKQNKGAKA